MSLPRNDAEVFDVQEMTPAFFFEDRFHSLPNFDLLPVGFL
jgi:hypothetical protein